MGGWRERGVEGERGGGRDVFASYCCPGPCSEFREWGLGMRQVMETKRDCECITVCVQFCSIGGDSGNHENCATLASEYVHV